MDIGSNAYHARCLYLYVAITISALLSLRALLRLPARRTDAAPRAVG